MEFERNKTMKEQGKMKREKVRTSLLFTFSLLLFTFAVQTATAAVPQVLTYRGVLARTGGFMQPESLLVTFSLYDGDSQTAVWARQINVAVDTSGAFYTELRDDAGSVPQGAPNTSLVDALAGIAGTPEIGIRPPQCAADLQPRQRLEWNARAGRAVVAKAADLFESPNGVLFTGGAQVDELNARDLTASNVIAKGTCTLLRQGVRTVGGAHSTTTVKGVRPETDAGTAKEGVRGVFTAGSATCDMAITYDSPNGAFTVLVPKGGKIVSSGGAESQLPQVRTATLFGK